MTQVFVSYAKQDDDVALPIIGAIIEAGLTVWKLSLGGEFEEQAEGSIKDATCIVVLWSKAAAESSFAERVIRLAIQAWGADRLVLATLDDAPLPVGLRDISGVSIRRASDVKQLIERVRAIVPREGKVHAPRVPREGMVHASRARASPIAIALFLGFVFLAGVATLLSYELLVSPPTLHDLGGPFQTYPPPTSATPQE